MVQRGSEGFRRFKKVQKARKGQKKHAGAEQRLVASASSMACRCEIRQMCSDKGLGLAKGGRELGVGCNRCRPSQRSFPVLSGSVLLLLLLLRFSFASPLLLLCFSFASPLLLLCFSSFCAIHLSDRRTNGRVWRDGKKKLPGVLWVPTV